MIASSYDHQPYIKGPCHLKHTHGIQSGARVIVMLQWTMLNFNDLGPKRQLKDEHVNAPWTRMQIKCNNLAGYCPRINGTQKIERCQDILSQDNLS